MNSSKIINIINGPCIRTNGSIMHRFIDMKQENYDITIDGIYYHRYITRVRNNDKNAMIDYKYYFDDYLYHKSGI